MSTTIRFADTLNPILTHAPSADIASLEDRIAAEEEERWTRGDWLFRLEPDERQWFWWDARLEDADRVRVTAEVTGWPAPLGALEWLLRAAGASQVEVGRFGRQAETRSCLQPLPAAAACSRCLQP